MNEKIDLDEINRQLDAGISALDKSMADDERAIPQYDKNPLSITGIRELSDLGNAERLADLWGNHIRYCHPTRIWYAWDNARWKQDREGTIYTKAAETVRTIYAEAARVEDKDKRRRVAQFALRGESQRQLGAMIALTQFQPGIPVLPEHLDTDPWKLNARNGTIDLHTGQLLPHDQSDMITKLAPVKYDPEARSALWEHFLDDATDNHQELRDYLARAVGASLLGIRCGEECMFFVYGAAATGKSTFLEAIKATLGDYAITADISTFMATGKGNIRSDVVNLAGSRIVITVESDENHKLADGFVKMYTGGDTLCARPLYRSEVEIGQRGMLWLVSNHRPKTNAGDDALWRRMRVIPFEHGIPEDRRDPALKHTLSDPEQSGAAILAWAVRGCLAWQRDGLRPPDCVRAATNEYRRDTNPIGPFVEECCNLGPLFSTSSSDLWEAYLHWAETNGIKRPMTRPAFGIHLKSLGLEPAHEGPTRTRTYRGIALTR